MRAIRSPPALAETALAPQLDYPGGRIGETYWLSEWLDCECHRDSAERDQADLFEEDLRCAGPLRIPPQLAEALASGADTRRQRPRTSEPAFAQAGGQVASGCGSPVMAARTRATSPTWALMYVVVASAGPAWARAMP